MKKGIIGIVVVLLFLFVGLFIFNRQQGIYLADSVVVPSITPLPQPRIAGEATSIDGVKKLTMKITPQEGGSASYAFLIADEEGEYTLFETTGKENSYSVPSNSWSPDARYVFLTDTSITPQSVYVFKVSGEPFANGEQYLRVTDLFTERFPERTFVEATGWDSRGLVHIKTDGPSFWFDADSSSFIQLAAR